MLQAAQRTYRGGAKEDRIGDPRQLVGARDAVIDRQTVVRLAREAVARLHASDQERQSLDVLECASEGLGLLARSGPHARQLDPFSPDSISYWHSRAGWAALVGAELGGSPSWDSTRGGESDPLALAEIKAQLECSLDAASLTRYHWSSVNWLYRRQERGADWRALRHGLGYDGRLMSLPLHATDPREPDAPFGRLAIFGLMAQDAGWTPESDGEAA